MSEEKKLEAKSGERAKRRPYEAPTIGDFFQPLVVLGTNPVEAFVCPGAARPKRPKP